MRFQRWYGGADEQTSSKATLQVRTSFINIISTGWFQKQESCKCSPSLACYNVSFHTHTTLTTPDAAVITVPPVFFSERQTSYKYNIHHQTDVFVHTVKFR